MFGFESDVLIIRWRYIRRCGYKYMGVILTDNFTQYLNLEHFASLTYKLYHSFSQRTIQNLITVFRGPCVMISNFILGMTALTVFHAKYYIKTAGFKLPA